MDTQNDQFLTTALSLRVWSKTCHGMFEQSIGELVKLGGCDDLAMCAVIDETKELSERLIKLSHQLDPYFKRG